MQAATETMNEQAENLKDDSHYLRAEADCHKTNFEKLFEEKRTLEVKTPSCISRSHCVVKAEAVRRTEEIQSLKRSIDVKEDEYSSLKVRVFDAELTDDY